MIFLAVCPKGRSEIVRKRQAPPSITGFKIVTHLRMTDHKFAMVALKLFF